MKILFILLMFGSKAFACDVLKDQMNPQLKKKLDDYEKFVVSLQSEKDPIKSINKRIKTDGLLLEAHINEKLVKNYPSSFHDDSITGARKLFLKNLKLPPGLHNDLIYEVATFDSTRAVRSWQIPSNNSFLGIHGNEIILRAYLGTPCSKFNRDVLLAVLPNGKYRAIPDMKIPEPKYNMNCAGSKTLYKGSEFGACLQLQDLKTNKQRIMVYQQPMT